MSLLTCAAVIVLGLVAPTAAAEPAAVQPVATKAVFSPPAYTSAETTAIAQAQRTGEPVEVLDQTTETSQVLANPDGSFTLKAHRRAVRVRQDGVWQPVDTTLRPNPDGSLTPVATNQDVTFSGGGTAPLVTVRHAGKALAFNWPTPLPAPTIDADTATYPAVLPGVDLRIIAHADSYSQVLVVHNADAAANPALATIRMNVTGTGLTLQVGADGSLTATDADGVAVLAGAAPLMWDSRIDDRVGPAPSDTEPGSGRITPLTVSGAVANAALSADATSTTELTLSPEPAALTGPDVVYPLYIDPTMGVRKQHWTAVTDNGWAPQYDANAFAQVGFCDRWEGCGGSWKARSYFEFPTAALQRRNGYRAVIYRAQLYAYQVWSADHNCAGGQPTKIWESASFGPTTTWPGPAYKEIDTQWSNAGGNCPSSNLVFNVMATTDVVAENSLPYVTFGLLAANENDRLQWKKFDNNPLLEVDFNFPPNQAVNIGLSNEIRCHGTIITPDARPILQSTATDNNDSPLQIGLGHEVWDSTLNTMRVNTPPPLTEIITSGKTGQWQIPISLGNGSYALRTSAQNIYPANADRNLWGPWSAWYPFTIDATPPPSTPTVGTSVDYPTGYWGAPNGAPGMIPISTPDTDAVGYAYTFLGSGTQTVPGTTDCDYHRAFGENGTSGGWLPNTDATVDWLPIPANLTTGYHTLHVKTFDDAHNMSAESTPYTFYVAPNTGLGTRRLEAESLSWSQPAGQNVTITPQTDCCGASWSGGAQLSFEATAAGQSATLSVAVLTEGDYQLDIALTKAGNYGIATFELDGQAIGDSVDGYYHRVVNAHLPLGVRHLTAGRHALKITIVGSNPNSYNRRYTAGIDYLTLTQTTQHEAEQLTISQPNGQNVSITTQAYDPREPGPGPFSEGLQRVLGATATGQSFNISFQTPVEADYALGAALSKWHNYGRIRIDVDDKPLLRTDETPWDGFSRNGETVYQPLGGLHLTAGTHTLELTVVGKHAISSGFRIGIDYFTAVAINNVTSENFAAAMNNDGISVDGTNASLDLNGAALSSQTLAAAGYAPGTTAMVNGASFTMPTPRAVDGADNVIAIGQTIPLPDYQQVRATAVGLLVASTCGEAPVNTATLTFTDNTRKDVRYPAVPDWVTGFSDMDVVKLPYRNEGATPVPSKRPTLYAIFAPSDPTRTLKSITLPNYGSSLLPGTCAPTLHVLAISPRPVATGWLGTWTAYARDTDTPESPTNFGNQTLRTVIRPTTTGQSVRIRLSNTRSPAPVTIDAASIAAQSGTGAATIGTPTTLTFGGNTQVTIPAGAEIYSDPVAFPTTAGGSGNLLVSIHLPTPVTAAPHHNTFHTPTFLATGNTTNNTTGTPFTTQINDYWYLSGAEVSTNQDLGTVAVLSDNQAVRAIPDDGPTWVDLLPAKLAAAGIPLPGGLVNPSSVNWEGPHDLIETLDRTVLNQPNLRTVIIALGSEDLYTGGEAEYVKDGIHKLINSTSPTGIKNYQRTDGTPIHVILVTVPPLTIDDPHPEQEAERQALNTDLQDNYTQYGADAVIDLSALDDPADPSLPHPDYFDRTTWDYLPAYFETIAQTVADQAAYLPPNAQL